MKNLIEQTENKINELKKELAYHEKVKDALEQNLGYLLTIETLTFNKALTVLNKVNATFIAKESFKQTLYTLCTSNELNLNGEYNKLTSSWKYDDPSIHSLVYQKYTDGRFGKVTIDENNIIELLVSYDEKRAAHFQNE